MKILSYSQILFTLRANKLRLDGVEYLLSDELSQYIAKHLPKAGSCIIGKDAILVAMTDPSQGPVIVMFQPNGPPDPGIVSLG